MSVVLRFSCTEDPTLELWRLEKITDDFESLFGHRLEMAPEMIPNDGSVRSDTQSFDSNN